jgi:hypothetical protein
MIKHGKGFFLFTLVVSSKTMVEISNIPFAPLELRIELLY